MRRRKLDKGTNIDKVTKYVYIKKSWEKLQKFDKIIQITHRYSRVATGLSPQKRSWWEPTDFENSQLGTSALATCGKMDPPIAHHPPGRSTLGGGGKGGCCSRRSAMNRRFG